MSLNSSIQLLDRQLLTTSTVLGSGNTRSIRVRHKTIRIQGTVLYSNGTDPVVSVSVEGSYDGKNWVDASAEGLIAVLDDASPDQAASSADVDVDFAYIRCRYELTGTDASAVVSAALVFSHRE